ncbi:hypothetical protein AB0O76_28860 [Streptomyces sp. NPDC086554]|uniref:hypothetical protein n=1 Tax=Streptomyces sp. NPDC086554 TaxID=3154864 RepID=UPI00341B3E20
MNIPLKAAFISGVLAITSLGAAGAAHAEGPPKITTTVAPAATPTNNILCDLLGGLLGGLLGQVCSDSSQTVKVSIADDGFTTAEIPRADIQIGTPWQW